MAPSSRHLPDLLALDQPMPAFLEVALWYEVGDWLPCECVGEAKNFRRS
jgi:hypothetical protein